MFFVHSFTSKHLLKLQFVDNSFLYNDQKVENVQLCGVMIEMSARKMKILDFYGLIDVFKEDIQRKTCLNNINSKNKVNKPEKGSFRFILKPFNKNGKIYLLLLDYYKITFEEELFYNYELFYFEKQFK
ncbi:hypothetical protein NUSPORA_00009 [Nucleospora cyclopteri]